MNDSTEFDYTVQVPGMIGWFDAFRDDFGPSNFGTLTHPCINVRTVIIFLLFVLPYISFLMILPGVREKRVISFVTITIQLLVGILIIASLRLPYWSVGDTVMVSQLKAFSTQRHEAKIGLRVGLKSINITMRSVFSGASLLEDNSLKPIAADAQLYINEKFTLNGVKDMVTEARAAYEEGLPYPVLKVLEYFRIGEDSFDFGMKYRQAGHYAGALIWFGFALWVWQTVLLLFLPHHYSKVGILCGIAVLIGDIIYAIMTPEPLNIPFMGKDAGTVFLSTAFGTSFYLSLSAGIISILFNLTLSVLQYIRVYTLSTLLSSSMDETVGPKCRYGRDVVPVDEFVTSHRVLAFAESTNIQAKKTDLTDPKLLIVNKTVGSSSGFQSGSSLRSSTKSILSSLASDRLQRTMSTDTMDHSHMTDDEMGHKDEFVEHGHQV
ncbi:unnamed protein product [Bursaphelenchus xylophilus]|uniref:(pine wood nematode) hypothetical protein n=1 Tax=Bursaphelenchus xylophilus TaxID=6326 RepID=A0A1I7SQJ7_BURXY|nr:unnamed protein product [Bursaphelenchus xylophilus]CAG9110002.1 unnamed protein product [Bursaphelenchus xylophilus]